jgi:hypothetical protein
MTEEQQKPVIKITDHYYSDDEITRALEQFFYRDVFKDEAGFYYRTETEV